MKIIQSSVYPEVDITATLEKETENFRVKYSGYIKLTIGKFNILRVDDSEISDTQYYFRGDKVLYHPLLKRLREEGYVDLVVELTALDNSLNLYPAQKKQERRLKQIYGVKKVYFFSDFDKECQVLLNMERVLRNFSSYASSIKQSYCNQRFGFNFEGDNLSNEVVTRKEFEERFDFLLEARPSMKKVFAT